MPLIDDRGRLFGKLNLIDAIVVFVVLLLIPLAYGAFLLFRVPEPTITSITPAQVTENETGSLQITGNDLRPFLRAKIGMVDAPFFVQSPTLGEIKLPPKLAPGAYDIVLMDEGQELVRKGGALTVVAARIEMEAVGVFVGLPQDAEGLIAAGSDFGTIAEVLAVRPLRPRMQRVRIGANVFVTKPLEKEWGMPAIIRLNCAIVGAECKVGDTAVAKNATITLSLSRPPAKNGSAPAAHKQVQFLIDEVFPAGMHAAFPAIASIRVRFVAEPEVLDVMKVGDVDLSGSLTPADEGRAVLTQVGSDRRTLTALSNNSEGLLRRTVQLEQPVLAFTGAVRVPVVFTPSGWSYKDRPVKVGAPFTFETAAGAMMGSIISMNLSHEKENDAP